MKKFAKARSLVLAVMLLALTLTAQLRRHVR